MEVKKIFYDTTDTDEDIKYNTDFSKNATIDKDGNFEIFKTEKDLEFIKYIDKESISLNNNYVNVARSYTPDTLTECNRYIHILISNYNKFFSYIEKYINKTNSAYGCYTYITNGLSYLEFLVTFKIFNKETFELSEKIYYILHKKIYELTDITFLEHRVKLAELVQKFPENKDKPIMVKGNFVKDMRKQDTLNSHTNLT